MSLFKTLDSEAASRVSLAALVFNLAALSALGQANVWSGSASCVATASGTFTDNNGSKGTFSYTETQIWAMTGGAPTPGTLFTSFPGTYTVSGSGYKQLNGGASVAYSTSFSTPRALQVQQLMGGRWKITPEQLTVSLAGTHISGYTTIYNVIELSFPAPESTMVPIVDSSSTTPTAAIVAQQPGGLTMTNNCSWHFGPPPAGSRFVPLPPCRIVDTRTFPTVRVSRLLPQAGYLQPTVPATLQIAGQCGVPVSSSVTAYSLNLTAVPIGALNSLAIKPSGQSAPALPVLSASDGNPTANAAIVPASASGSVEVSVSNNANVIIDVNGYFDSSNGNAFYALPTVCRAADTRSTSGPTGGAMLPGGTSQSFALRSSACNIPVNVQAYALSVTVAPAGFFGGLTIWPTGQAMPNVSTLNAYDGQTKTNMAIIQAGTNGEAAFAPFHSTHLAVDIIGYFAPTGGTGALTYTPLPSCRAVNTSLAAMTGQGFTLQGSCGLPFWAKAYSLNFTATPNAPLTGLTAMPAGQTSPASSILSAGDGEVTASNTIVGASTNGAITVVTASATRLTVDAWGYFAQ